MKQTGLELTRNGNNDDPVKGSNVTLICRAHWFNEPPKWKYGDKSGALVPIDDANPSKG